MLNIIKLVERAESVQYIQITEKITVKMFVRPEAKVSDAYRYSASFKKSTLNIAFQKICREWLKQRALGGRRFVVKLMIYYFGNNLINKNL